MFKTVVGLMSVTRNVVLGGATRNAVVLNRHMSHGRMESDEDFDNRYEKFFNKSDIDGWEIRKAVNDLCGMDLVPDPRLINSALRACRRINDYALAIRFLEVIKFKCGSKEKEIYPYILQEIQPTLDELGLETPDKLGYDKPELALSTVYDIN